MKRWCEQCQMHGHRKWLFLGTHQTHRWYLKFQIWRVERRLRNGKDQEEDFGELETDEEVDPLAPFRPESYSTTPEEEA